MQSKIKNKDKKDSDLNRKYLLKYRPDLKHLCKFYSHKILLIYLMLFYQKCFKPPFLKRDFYIFKDYFVFNQLISFNWHYTYSIHPIDKYIYFQLPICKYKDYKFSLGASFYYAIPDQIYYEIGLFFENVVLFVYPDIIPYELPLTISEINYIIDFDYFDIDFLKILEQIDNLLSFATCNNLKFDQIKLFVDYRYCDFILKLKNFLAKIDKFDYYLDLVFIIESMSKNNQIEYVKVLDKDKELNFKMIKPVN